MSWLRATREGFAELAHTFREIRKYRPLVWFLAAYILYIDGVNTVIKMAVDYGLSLGLRPVAPGQGVAAHAVRGVSGRARVRLARRPDRGA